MNLKINQLSHILENNCLKISPELVPIWLADDMDDVSSFLFDKYAQFGKFDINLVLLFQIHGKQLVIRRDVSLFRYSQ